MSKKPEKLDAGEVSTRAFHTCWGWDVSRKLLSEMRYQMYMLTDADVALLEEGKFHALANSDRSVVVPVMPPEVRLVQEKDPAKRKLSGNAASYLFFTLASEALSERYLKEHRADRYEVFSGVHSLLMDVIDEMLSEEDANAVKDRHAVVLKEACHG